MDKSPDAFRTISEVADYLETPAHVLRFWESRFPQIKPVKRAGGRRYYRPADVALLSGIKRLLHDDGMTIRGVQKILREQGVRHVAGLVDADAVMDAEVFPPIEALDEVLNPSTPEIASAEIVPFAPRAAEPDDAPEPAAVTQPELSADVLVESTEFTEDAPFVDTEAEPEWEQAPADNPAKGLFDDVLQEPEPNVFAPEPVGPIIDSPAPVDLWAAAGVAPPPPAPPRKPVAPVTTDDGLIDVDLSAPLPLATRLRALTPQAAAPHQAELIALRDRLLALREQIAQAAHVRSR